MKKMIILCSVMSLLLMGCAYFQKQGTEAGDPAPAAKAQGFNQAFYGFPDVPIPKEVEIVNDRSFVYETPSFKAGVIVFSGNVEPASLENYFKINMSKNGWKYVNSFRYKDIVMNYVKENKTCNVKISRGAFQTELEVWIGPADGSMTPRPESVARPETSHGSK
ncbi:MAG: MlaA family lipoprotein [Syntrophorhabdaceae bacterium]